MPVGAYGINAVRCMKLYPLLRPKEHILVVEGARGDAYAEGNDVGTCCAYGYSVYAEKGERKEDAYSFVAVYEGVVWDKRVPYSAYFFYG